MGKPINYTCPMEKEKTEQELAMGLLANNPAAFDELYKRFSPILYGLLVKWVRDEQIAENLLQDTFIKIWRNSGQYNPQKGRLFIWAYRITRNICIDHLRSRGHKKSKACIGDSKLLNYLIARPGSSISPDHIGLNAILKTLARQEKEVLELLYFKGYTQAEVAKIKGIPLGTVKTYSARGIKTLRRFFEQENQRMRVSLIVA